MMQIRYQKPLDIESINLSFTFFTICLIGLLFLNISKILASLFIGAFCLLTLIYGEFSKTITFNRNSFLSLVREWLPYIGYYILVGIAVVAYQTFKDWHLGQYIEYRIELYNKELLHGLSHFYLSNEIKRVPYISEMKKNIADIFISQKDMK